MSEEQINILGQYMSVVHFQNLFNEIQGEGFNPEMAPIDKQETTVVTGEE